MADLRKSWPHLPEEMLGNGSGAFTDRERNTTNEFQSKRPILKKARKEILHTISNSFVF